MGAKDYLLLSHNCCHFAAALVAGLGLAFPTYLLALCSAGANVVEFGENLQQRVAQFGGTIAEFGGTVQQTMAHAQQNITQWAGDSYENIAQLGEQFSLLAVESDEEMRRSSSRSPSIKVKKQHGKRVRKGT